MIRPLRIAIDAMQVGKTPAGIGRYITELVRALDTCAGEDYEITAYTSVSAQALLEWNPKRVRVVPVGESAGTKRRILQQQLTLPKLVKERSDVVHYPDYLTALSNPTPCVVTIHDVAYTADTAFYPWPQRMIRHIMYPVALRAGRTIVAVSEFTRQEILRVFPSVDADKVRVVYSGILPPGGVEEDAHIAALRDRLQLPERFILSVCTREPRKNLDRLLHAFGQCPELANEHLVLVGRAGWGPDSLAVLNKYGSRLARRVMVTGYVEEQDLAALYRMASAFVYVSLMEGFGLPPLEALAHGAPLVVSDIPVLHETLGNNAQFVNPFDIEAIAAGIRRVLDEPVPRSQLVARGTSYVQRYTWEKCARQMLEIYRAAAA